LPLARDLARHARNSAIGARAWLATDRDHRQPTVWYGFGHVPRRTEVAIGGAIKLQHLTDVFPNTPKGFNLLYLGSSRLPAGAVSMVQFSRLKGARLVWNQNGVAYPAWHPTGWQEANAPMVPLLHGADYVLYQSEFCRQAAHRYLGKRHGAGEILYNAVDTSEYVPGPPLPTKPLVLLLGGSQMHFYRIATAIRTLAEVARTRPAVELLVTGRLGWTKDAVGARASVLQLAAELGVADRLHLLGPYTQQEAPAIFQRAHILLHTKVNDPCPTVVIEAQSAGLPVVYSATGGVPELVGEEAGAGVPGETNWERVIPPDPVAMAAAVERVAANLRVYAEAARQRAVERFDVKPWLQRHREVFEQVLQ
jgi:glycosyltransferase involved in cell wall biosynthesis